MTYTQTELQSPPELGQLNQLGKLAGQLALRSEIAEQIKTWLSVEKNEIEIVLSKERWATVEELMNDGYRLSAPRDLYRQKHS